MPLPATLVFDYPTPAAIAGLIAQLMPTSTAMSQPAYSYSAAATAMSASQDALRQHSLVQQRGAAEVLGVVTSVVREVLGSDPGSPDTPLMAAGLDSLSAVELRNSLEARFALQLPATLAYDLPTISTIAQHIARQLPQPAVLLQREHIDAVPSSVSGPQRALRSSAAVTIAVVGMSVRTPSASTSMAGVEVSTPAGHTASPFSPGRGPPAGLPDAVRPVPLSRWATEYDWAESAAAAASEPGDVSGSRSVNESDDV
jgi:acyl carrier protein